MKTTRVSTVIVQRNFPRVPVKIETDKGITGLGEAYWGVGIAEVIIGESPTTLASSTR